MTEETPKKTLTLKKPLSQTPVRGVQVEVRKKRTLAKDVESDKAQQPEISEEMAARLKLLSAAQKYEAEQAELRRQQEEKRKEENALAAAKAEEEAKVKASAPESSAVETARKPAEAPKPKVFHDAPKDDRRKSSKELAEEEFSKRRRVIDLGEKRPGKVNLRDVSSSEDGDDGRSRGRSLTSIRRAREKERLKMLQKTQEKVIRDVVIPEAITVQELANRMSERAADVIKTLMKMGMMVTITETIDADTAQLVVEEFGHKWKRVADSDVEEGLVKADDDASALLPRPPVVTVMGHVDHGKTSLLDALRSTRVAESEHGGITQHIGAYQVEIKGKKITFIDTPGHAAFTEMRSRGAQITDIVILVVAANDGVMPQTIEAITHAKAAGVPLVVAINKIDVPGADANRVRMELLNHEVVVESMGGDVQAVEISAKHRQNLDKLMEAVLLQAEMLDLKANPNRSAEGAVIEAKMEKGRGPVATVLVQKGTLKTGDIVVAGKEWGKVRALLDEFGKKKEKALPSEPVEILGLENVPHAGDDCIVVESEGKAREISNYRTRKEREAQHVKSAKNSLENIFDRMAAGEVTELPVIVKVDVQGSLEALVGSLNKISTDKARIKIVGASVGSINESDVTLAKASNAFIIGFNVRANNKAREIARRDGVDIRYYSVIYDAIDEVKQALEGMLSPILKENITGYAEIRQVFNITGVGKVGGCMVTEGKIVRSGKIRLLRDNVVMYAGDIGQLKHFKDDVKEAKEGTECGISFAGYNDIQVGDMIECFEVEKIAAKL